MRKALLVASALALFATGWHLRAWAGAEDWTYDPDPSVESIYVEAATAKAETEKVEKRIVVLLKTQEPIEARRAVARVELEAARRELDAARQRFAHRDEPSTTKRPEVGGPRLCRLGQLRHPLPAG